MLEDCGFFREPQRAGGAVLFCYADSRKGAGTCSDASFHFGARVFYFTLNIFPRDTGESTPQPPTFPHHNPVQKKRRPVCHQCINVRRRAAGLYLHSELSRAKGASGFPLMSCMQKRGGGIFMRDRSSVSGGVYFMS